MSPLSHSNLETCAGVVRQGTDGGQCQAELWPHHWVQDWGEPKLISFFSSGGFSHLFNLDLSGHQHSVLKHPRLEEPLLQVCSFPELCIACHVSGLLVYSLEKSVVHHRCRTWLCLFAAFVHILFQLTFIGSEYAIGNILRVVRRHETLKMRVKKLCFLLQSCVYSTWSQSWEKISTFPPQRPGQRGWWWCRLRPDKLWGDSTVLRDLRAIAESRFCIELLLGRRCWNIPPTELCVLAIFFSGNLRPCRVF